VQIVVAGAGIGGLAAAFALIDRGHQVRVLEADPQLRRGGAGISIWPNGHAALRRLGLTLPDAGQRVETLRVLRSDGSPLHALDVADLERRFGFETRLLRRRDLVDHLFAALPDGAVEFGREVCGLQAAGDGMRVRTTAGDPVAAQLVVGADGHRSGVRRHVHDTGAAIPTGIATWQGVQPVDVDTGHPGESLYIQGDEGWCGLMPAGDSQLQWWFDLPADIAESVPPAERIAVLRDRFRGWPAPVADVIAQLDGHQIEPWSYTRHPVPRRLYRDRAVLIGDAAHAMPPTLAQGASQTLDDAWALVDALDRSADLASALRRYQRRRRTRAAIVTRAASSRLALRGPSPPLARLGRLVSTRRLTRGYGTCLRLVSYGLSSGRR
jgi:FAD-dependent urate hydroxylase